MDIVAGVDFLPRVDGVIRKETDVLLGDVSGKRIYSGGEVGEASESCLSDPALIVAVAVKNDPAVCGQFAADQVCYAVVKISRFLQVIRKLHQFVCHDGVENDVGTRDG